MSVSRPAGQGASVSLMLAIVFPAMAAAAVALAYYGYRYVEDLSGVLATSFRESSRNEASHALDLAQDEIDDVSRDLFSRVEVHDDLSAADGATPCDAELNEPAIDAYDVFWPKGPKDTKEICQGGKKLTEWRTYRTNLDLGSLQPGSFRYLHRQFENRSYALIAYMRKQTESGRDYFIAIRFREDFLRETIDRELARGVGKGKRVAVMDEQGRAIPGSLLPAAAPVSRAAERFAFEAPLGKTLYAWRVQIVPVDVEALEKQVERQRVVGPLLVALATIIILVGLVIVWLGVRAERRASRLKSDFIANVSHELKTPLSLIRMFGEMIATGRHKGEATAREYGGIITRESERLSHLIDNVLDFARLERGKASYDFAEGDLAEVVERGLDVCRYRLEKEKMRLTVRIDPGLPLVRMDENAMTLVLLNLVDNATKYAAEGGEVEVTLARTPGGVVLSVQDNGPGIAEDEQRRVFERFYRSQTARDRNVRGSGIGLSLVMHIARAHGGRVTVESPVPGAGPGRNPGAVFRVYVPAPIAEGSESAQRHYVIDGDTLPEGAALGPAGPAAGGRSS